LVVLFGPFGFIALKDRDEISEILLKVALNTITLLPKILKLFGFELT
jgi:hypothetical protein